MVYLFKRDREQKRYIVLCNEDIEDLKTQAFIHGVHVSDTDIEQKANY